MKLTLIAKHLEFLTFYYKFLLLIKFLVITVNFTDASISDIHTCVKVYTHTVNMLSSLIIYIKILLDCDWLISVKQQCNFL